RTAHSSGPISHTATCHSGAKASHCYTSLLRDAGSRLTAVTQGAVTHHSRCCYHHSRCLTRPSMRAVEEASAPFTFGAGARLLVVDHRLASRDRELLNMHRTKVVGHPLTPRGICGQMQPSSTLKPVLYATGEVDRLKELLAKQLEACGWVDDVRERCKAKIRAATHSLCVAAG
ncbi:transcription factor e(y)2, partial [Haematococcus lacustris]